MGLLHFVLLSLITIPIASYGFEKISPAGTITRRTPFFWPPSWVGAVLIMKI
jgi:hypothetical protein